MKKYTEIGLFLLISSILPLQISAIPALANELWVSPSEAKTTYGNWGVTGTGIAHFSFTVPDDMINFTSAKIVIIPTGKLNLLYNVTITVASDGQLYTNSLESDLNLSDSLPAKELQEIDVSSTVPITLTPGQDHISIYFASHPADSPYLRVMGLRFTYVSSTIGPQGPQGPTGPQGPQGPPGPLNPDIIIPSSGGNTAIGINASSANTTGTNNTASGYQALGAYTTGSNNTANGYQALYQTNGTGNNNTAIGYQALFYTFSDYGNNNTASGYQALYSNDGNNNTASGYQALCYNIGDNNTAIGYQAFYRGNAGGTPSDDNTAIGAQALYSNSGAWYNTAIGYQALYSNTSGYNNTATGVWALQLNTTGWENNATGWYALGQNTTGSINTADGYSALSGNTTGSQNTAIGAYALTGNTTGSNNTSIGYAASSNTTGNNNVVIGYMTGWYNVPFIGEPTTGSSDIYIGHDIHPQSADESYTIRIGSDQTATYIAGIVAASWDAAGTGVEVYANSDGQLSTVSSSRRYKEDIEDMGDASSGLMNLRPVTFHYKPEYSKGPRTIQYGLIAEEVAEVYPGLVQYDLKTGQPQTVYYHLVNAMLLNEVQKQERRILEQDKELSSLKEQVRELSALKERVSKLETQLH